VARHLERFEHWMRFRHEYPEEWQSAAAYSRWARASAGYRPPVSTSEEQSLRLLWGAFTASPGMGGADRRVIAFLLKYFEREGLVA
jgi:hypothetical protein